MPCEKARRGVRGPFVAPRALLPRAGMVMAIALVAASYLTGLVRAGLPL